MATLLPPIAVIASPDTGTDVLAGSATGASNKAWQGASDAQIGATDMGGEIQPPLATYHDAPNRCFIAFYDDRRGGDYASGAGANFRIQTFTIPDEEDRRACWPKPTFTSVAPASPRSSDGGSKSKPEITTAIRCRPGTPMRLTLPDELVAGVSGADDERTEMVVPLLAKQSMEGRCLALQFSPTLVRLVHMQKPARSSDCPPRRPMASQTPISPESFPDADVSSNPSTPTQLQWTIDLAPTTDSGPFVVASAPSRMPTQNGETAAFSSAAGQGQGPTTNPAAAVGAFATFLRRRRVPSGGGVGALGRASFGDILPGGVLFVDGLTSDSTTTLVIVCTSSIALFEVNEEGRTARLRVRLMDVIPLATPASGFWYEPGASVLLVAAVVKRQVQPQAFDDSPSPAISPPATMMELRPYIFQQATRAESKKKPRVVVLDPLLVKTPKLDSIGLVSAYGHAYCTEIGILEDGRARVKVFKLDASTQSCTLTVDVVRADFRLSLDSKVRPPSVAVADNVIVIASPYSKSCLIIDVLSAQSTGSDGGGSKSACCYCAAAPHDLDEKDEMLYSNDANGNTLLSPFLLDSKDQGSLYEIILSQEAIVNSCRTSEDIIPFLLRRSQNVPLSHELALQLINNAINEKRAMSRLSLLRLWFGHIAQKYHRLGVDVSSWDYDACLTLMADSALLSIHNTHQFPIENDEELCGAVLTQTEMLRRLFLPRCKKAAQESNIDDLSLMLDVSLLYMNSLERCGVLPVPALECLIVAMLWKLERGEDAVALLKGRRKRMKDVGTTINASSGNGKVDAVQEAFAEMLLAVVNNEKLPPEDESNASAIIVTELAIDLFCKIGSFQVGSKHLLRMGRVTDAITLSSKINGVRGGKINPRFIAARGSTGSDFFKAAVQSAERMQSIGDRCRLFFNVHSFISDYDPDSLKMTMIESDESSAELQSDLARKYGAFPSSLFGERDAEICLKALFGFAIALETARP